MIVPFLFIDEEMTGGQGSLGDKVTTPTTPTQATSYNLSYIVVTLDPSVRKLL